MRFSSILGVSFALAILPLPALAALLEFNDRTSAAYQHKAREQESVFTLENIANAERLFDVKLSPDAEQLLYHVQPLYESDEQETCAIWLGDVGKADSARQFTDGLFNDQSARFHPDGKGPISLSDRHEAGRLALIYSINLEGDNATLFFGENNKRGVTSFSITPDGRYIAFASPGEPTPEDEQREDEKDDVQVFFDDKSNFDRLSSCYERE